MVRLEQGIIGECHHRERAKDFGRQDGDIVPNPEQFKPGGVLLLLQGAGQPSSAALASCIREFSDG